VRPTSLLALSFFCVVGASAACAVRSDAETEDDGARAESNANEEKDLYGPNTVLPVKLVAPLTTLFTRLKQGQADPPKPPKDGEAPVGFQAPEFSEPGKMTITVEGAERTLDLRVYIRGESSKADCPFPKLKIDFDDKEQLKGTPFKGHGKFRLNTHCGPGDASARSELGRVTNGVGPVREELTYRLIRAMGVPTYKTRVLAIRYEDTSTAADASPDAAPDGAPDGAPTVTETFAMAVESGDDAAERFQKAQPAIIPESWEYLDPSSAGGHPPKPENLAQVTFAEAFSGNKDWGGTHNVDSFGPTPVTEIFQIAQDFDLGGIVLADIARYWKGIAPVTDGQASLRVGDLAKTVASHKADVLKAYADAEKAAIAGKAVVSADGQVTTDPGFIEAKHRIDQLYALPEIANALAADAGAADPADAGTD
jgi:hypothetical protein